MAILGRKQAASSKKPKFRRECKDLQEKPCVDKQNVQQPSADGCPYLKLAGCMVADAEGEGKFTDEFVEDYRKYLSTTRRYLDMNREARTGEARNSLLRLLKNDETDIIYGHWESFQEESERLRLRREENERLRAIASLLPEPEPEGEPVLKHRNGATGTFKLLFDGAHCRFRNLATR